LKDPLAETHQRATAMYLIDRLALRAGNEKGEDEADTVGCCSLRCEHITLEEPNTLHFDFLGKDSIRYQNSVQVEQQVFKNIKTLKKNGKDSQSIFTSLSTSGLNKHLNRCMKGLTAKVFRTFNASITFQQQVDLLTNSNDSIPDKLLSYNRANREVAILCNHQRTAPKTHDQMIAKIGDRIRAFKYQRMKYRKQLFALDPKMKKRPEYAEPESDLEDDWIVEHEKDLVEKEKEKIKKNFDKQNEKLVAAKGPRMPASELKEKLKAAAEMHDRLKQERKLAKIEPKGSMTIEKLIAHIQKIDDRIIATKNQATDKEENKEVALGTSKLNYIDPRISVAWCREHGVPMEKVFTKTLVEKFRWAHNIPEDWVCYYIVYTNNECILISISNRNSNISKDYYYYICYIFYPYHCYGYINKYNVRHSISKPYY
jgi:DNA topoisomerase-1